MRNSKWIVIGLLTCTGLLTGAIASHNARQPELLQAQLVQMPQTNYFTLDKANSSVSKKFSITSSLQSLNINSAHDPNVSFKLISPDGKIIDANNIGSMGTFAQKKSENGKMTAEAILHSPAPGEWSVVYTLNGQDTGRAVLESVIMGDDALSGQVMVDYDQVQNRPFPISVALFKGTEPVKNANVKLVLTNWRTKQETILHAIDNGDQNAGDAKAGDGLYSVTVETLPPAFYLASAHITATEEDEIMISNFFSVKPPTALLQGTVIDEGIDDDGDGMFDRIALHFPVKEVHMPGRYSINAVLRGSNGKEITSNNAIFQLSKGESNATITFDAKRLRDEIAVDGPYEIAEVDFLWNPDWDTQLAESLPNSHITQHLGNMGITKPYKLSDLPTVALQMRRYLGDRGIDTNGNGLFDQIEIEFEIESIVDMPFTWSAALAPADNPYLEPPPGKQYEDMPVPMTAENQGTLKRGLNKVKLTFDVGLYGSEKISGPYTLRNTTFTEVNSWPKGFENKGYDELFDIPGLFGTTQAYQYQQLENGRRLLNIDELHEFIGTVPMNVNPMFSRTHRNNWHKKLSEAKRFAQSGNFGLAASHLNAIALEVRRYRGKMLMTEDADLILDSLADIQKSHQR